jgi:hypothetical protein
VKFKKLFCSGIAVIFLNVSGIAQETAGKISGLMYADYFYNISRDTGFTSLPNTAMFGREDLNGFEIRRVYFTYDHRLSTEFSGRVRLEADGITLTQNNKIGVFLKDAFLRWKDILPGQDIYFGIQPTPAFEVSEMVYGYRSLEKTILDHRGIVSSRDFGIAARGKIAGDLRYWFLFGNNSGNSPETDRYKRIYTHLSYIPYKHFVTTIYWDLRFRQKTEDPIAHSGLISNNILTTAVFFGYNNSGLFSAGIEAFYSTAHNNITRNGTLRDINSGGLSFFGNVDILNNLQFTARYDIYDPGLNTDFSEDKRHFYLTGISYKPVESVQIIPNLVVETYEDNNTRAYDPSITARLTVAYLFH